MKLTRRTFLFVGAAGAAALVASRLLVRQAPPPGLGIDGATIVAAIAPVMLDGALPASPEARADALADTVAGVARAIDGLPPLAQGELARLFALLASAPGRWSLLRTTRDWSEASPEEVGRFLDRLRDSRIGLLRAAYDALHQLLMAAWYGAPGAWPSIGYPGPPMLR